MTIKNKGVLSILLAGTFLSTTATAADGVYTIEEGSVNNYNFTMKEPDGNGNLVTKYYKIVLNPENFSNPEKVKWETAEAAGENTIEVNIPNETKYFKYTYTKPDTYLEANENIDDTLASANVTGVVFNGMSEGNHGGAINNSQDNSSVTITADFIGNQASDNSRNYGGAIYNSGTIGNINGDFIGNFLQDGNAYGGAIFNEGTIGNINGDFIGNYAQSSSNIASGGAIYKGSIDSVIGVLSVIMFNPVLI